MEQKQQGFTLIELSIVLVIIGLIVGGILVGQDLINAAKLRSVYNDIQKIETAMNVYRQKYNCVPGDCARAESFWGSDTNCPNTSANSVVKLNTCNGNGDKMIFPGGATYRYENFRMWQQLGNAELIDQRFSGTAAINTLSCEGTVHCYTTEFDGKFVVRYMNIPLGNFTGGDYQFPMVGHFISFGRPSEDPGFPDGKILTPADAKRIDEKFDDGLPGKGIVLGNPKDDPDTPDCSTTQNLDTAEYKLNLTGLQCHLFFKISNSRY